MNGLQIYGWPGSVLVRGFNWNIAHPLKLTLEVGHHDGTSISCL
jgi:hypothetical protein